MTPYEQAKRIVDYEARRDKQGHLEVYKLPNNDGGGTREVAGLNDKYHPEVLNKVEKLLDQKKYEQAEDEVIKYIQKYTDKNASYLSVPSIQFALRDAAFNRGPTGSVKIMQMALGVTVDGKVGPKTLSALKAAESNPRDFLLRFRGAREDYEMDVVGYRKNLYAGLKNRWDRQLKDSLAAL